MAIWKRSLPVQVKAAIAGKDFTAADQVFDTCGAGGATVAAINMANLQPGSDGLTGQVSSPKPAEDPGQRGGHLKHR